jgi:hypothetical protein
MRKWHLPRRKRGKEDLMDTNRELPAPSWKDRITNARSAVQSRVTNLKPANLKPMLSESLHSRPGLWTGVAAAAGLGVGLLGRLVLNRTQRRGMPAVVIIEASC